MALASISCMVLSFPPIALVIIAGSSACHLYRSKIASTVRMLAALIPALQLSADPDNIPINVMNGDERRLPLRR